MKFCKKNPKTEAESLGKKDKKMSFFLSKLGFHVFGVDFFGKIFSEKISFCGKEQMTPPGVENFVPAKLFPWKIFWPRNFFFSSRKIFSREKSWRGQKNVNPTVAFPLNLGIKKS